MGLDLILYRKHKDLKDMNLEEELASQLAYGRKTWAIADFFTRRCKMLEDDWLFEITKADWDAFIEALSDLRNPDFVEKIHTLIEYDEVEYIRHMNNCIPQLTENILDEDEYYNLYNELEEWLDRALNHDYGYQLGLEWELAAVLRWFDANPEVQKTFEEGMSVGLIQSY